MNTGSSSDFRGFKCVGARLFSESDYRQIVQDKHPKDTAAFKQFASGAGFRFCDANNRNADAQTTLPSGDEA